MILQTDKARLQGWIKTLVVREDGTVLPEIPTLHPRFALGDVHEATLPELVARYFAGGYAEFSRFCRAVFAEVLPEYHSPIVPWDEIVSERSWLAASAGPSPASRP